MQDLKLIALQIRTQKKMNGRKNLQKNNNNAPRS